jgi:glycerophosphoryl diester phosphodiesterase
MTELSWLTARPIAHRGYHDMNNRVWENTLSAFERAAQKGYAIECDVHLSSDGVPVVFHDTTLNAADRHGRLRLAAHSRGDGCAEHRRHRRPCPSACAKCWNSSPAACRW